MLSDIRELLSYRELLWSWVVRDIKVREQGFTHLHAHWANEATEMAMILSRLSGLPFSFTCHAVDIFVSPQYLEEKLRAARFVVTVSGYNKRYLVDHYGSDFEDKIHVIYPLVDIQEFAPRPPLYDDEINILSVGRLVEKKAPMLSKQPGFSKNEDASLSGESSVRAESVHSWRRLSMLSV